MAGLAMFRISDSILPDTTANFTLFNPIILSGVIALCLDTGRLKAGNGTDHWVDLPYVGGGSIGDKPIESGTPSHNEIIRYESSLGEWIYSLQGAIGTVDDWENTAATYPTFCVLIETDEDEVLTGRIKISNGTTRSDQIEWVGFNFAEWPTGYSLVFNGSELDYEHHQGFNVLPYSVTPVGKVVLDDGTWGYPTIINPVETIVADLIEVNDLYVFATMTLGGYPTEATSVTLSTDGTDLFIDAKKVWNAYNDGLGSGLDADTLDGYHSTAFATVPTSITANNFVSFGSTSNELLDSGYNYDSFATIGGDGDVTGPASSVTGNIATFADTTGKVIEDSNYNVSDFATPGDLSTITQLNGHYYYEYRNTFNITEIANTPNTDGGSEYICLVGNNPTGDFVGYEGCCMKYNGVTWDVLTVYGGY